jgi:ubiquinone/menaquinone biosynthesis C-methylase UbiE
MTRPDIKQQEKEAYDSIAEVFDAVWARYTARFASDLIDLMAPQSGEITLDLAGGTGAAGLKLAERLGPKGRVTIIDLSPRMLQQAEVKAAARLLNNVTARVMDGENLDFPDQSFDLIVCSFGIMFFPNVPRALAEARRVLRPGGRIGFTVWSVPERVPFISYPSQATITRVAPAPVRLLLHAPIIGRRLLRKIMTSTGSLGYSGMRFSRPGSLEKIMRDAGFQSLRRELRAFPLQFDNFDHYWEALTQGTPAKERYSRLSPHILAEAREEVRAKLANPTTGKIDVFNEAALILGRKP